MKLENLTNNTCVHKIKAFNSKGLEEMEKCYYCEDYNDNDCEDYKPIKIYQIPIRRGVNAYLHL